MTYPVDPLLPNSRLQCLKALLLLAEKEEAPPRWFVALLRLFTA